MRPSRLIDLSVMWAKGKDVPEVISLDDCHPVNFHRSADRTSGFYGFHARGKGLQYCTLNADSNGYKFIPVTFSVQLERDIHVGMVGPETLAQVDMLNVGRASRELIDLLATFWFKRRQEKGVDAAVLSAINWRFPEHFMHLDESIVDDLLELPEFSHLRLFVYPAFPQKNPGVIHAPLYFGVTKKEFIVRAFSPMRHDLRVDDYPSDLPSD